MKNTFLILLSLVITGCASEGKLLSDLTVQKNSIEEVTCRQVLVAYEEGKDIEPYVRFARSQWTEINTQKYGSALAMSQYQSMNGHMRLVVVECMKRPDNPFVETYVESVTAV